jgi:tol-pal system protein YbgF
MIRYAALVATSILLTACVVTPPEEDPVQIKLNELDARLTRIERANQSVVEMAQRLEAAQAEVRTLQGRIEELENSSESLRKQQRDLYSDLERRMAQSPTPALVPGSTGIAGTTGAAGTTGVAGAAGGVMPGGAAGTAVDEQAAYTQAFDALKSGNYAQAIAGFTQFRTIYPNSALSENAQYWLGEAYYVTRDYANAAPAFRTVIDRWPASRKAPDALLKLGYTQQELKQTALARATLTEVTQRYPGTEAARLAAERLRRLPADGR